jgi:hypothetical protein
MDKAPQATQHGPSLGRGPGITISAVSMPRSVPARLVEGVHLAPVEVLWPVPAWVQARSASITRVASTGAPAAPLAKRLTSQRHPASQPGSPGASLAPGSGAGPHAHPSACGGTRAADADARRRMDDLYMESSTTLAVRVRSPGVGPAAVVANLRFWLRGPGPETPSLHQTPFRAGSSGRAPRCEPQARLIAVTRPPLARTASVRCSLEPGPPMNTNGTKPEAATIAVRIIGVMHRRAPSITALSSANRCSAKMRLTEEISTNCSAPRASEPRRHGAGHARHRRRGGPRAAAWR